MRIIAQTDNAITIELISEEQIWEKIYAGEVEFGAEIPAKIVIQNHQALLFYFIPKMIKDSTPSKHGKHVQFDVEHIKRERKTIDYGDFLILNKAIAQINAPLYDMLPK